MPSRRPEIVVPDTNFVLSALLFEGSGPAVAMSLAITNDILLGSVETLAELTEVLARPKFDPFVSRQKRMAAQHRCIEMRERGRRCRIGNVVGGHIHGLHGRDRALLGRLLDFRRSLQIVEVTHQVLACRDPKDNKFLALAISGKANVIVTGDADLLVLHPFRGIDIVSPRDYILR